MWRDLAGARFFITGGTGFYGKWLLESIAAANDALGTHTQATILSRDPARFSAEVPHLAARPEFNFLVGDTDSFVFPAAHFDYVFHFATASAEIVGSGDTAPLLASLAGTGRILKFTRAGGAHRLIFASSGAVYGHQPAELSHIPEGYMGSPDLTRSSSAYGEMKRLSEVMCVSSPEVNAVIARGFSFIGPYLPLTDKFAIGSFIRQAITGGPLRLHSDGSPIRSYLYAADLVIWLLTILLRGKPSAAYNVGSDNAISLADLARSAALAAGGNRVEIAQAVSLGEKSGRYVPSIEKARHELGLAVRVPLHIGLQRMIEWARRNQ